MNNYTNFYVTLYIEIVTSRSILLNEVIPKGKEKRKRKKQAK